MTRAGITALCMLSAAGGRVGSDRAFTIWRTLHPAVRRPLKREGFVSEFLDGRWWRVKLEPRGVLVVQIARAAQRRRRLS